MNNFDLELQRSMTNEQRLAFQSEYLSRRKDSTIGVLLALFLGGFGAHHFYLGNNGLGIVYIVFFWTFIPAIVALVEAFLMPGRVERWNNNLASEVANRVRLLYNQAPGLQAFASSATVYCTSCGKAITAGSKFCSSCGAASAAAGG